MADFKSVGLSCGDVVRIGHEQVVLVRATGDRDWWGFILQQGGESGSWSVEVAGRWDGEGGEFALRARVDRPKVLSAEGLVAVGRVEARGLDEVLRMAVKIAADTHRVHRAPPDRRYLPPSGKVLGREEMDGMVDASLDMWLTSGRFSDEFEKKLAERLGARFALAVNSGSSANLLAVAALTSPALGDRRLKPGDEVVTVAAGFPTTVAPIVQNGLVPVFVDVEVGHYNADVSHIEESLTSDTKAIFLAHTLGNPFNVPYVRDLARRRGLWLIEDNCDALGARVGGTATGTFGDIGTCSFYPAHHITMGEGGAVLTQSPQLKKLLLAFRDWGRDCWCPPGKDNTCRKRFDQRHGRLPDGYDHKYVYSHLGFNLKITDWQGAIGLAQLGRLEEFVRVRRDNFERLKSSLKDLESMVVLPFSVPGAEPSWFGFPLTVRDSSLKPKLVEFLESRGIGTRHLFAGNILRQPAFVSQDIPLRIRHSGRLVSSKLTPSDYDLLPNTEKIMNATFWVGVWPGLAKEEIDRISTSIHEFFQTGPSRA